MLPPNYSFYQTLQLLMKELGSVQAEKIKSQKPKYCVVHRKEGDNDFVSVLLNDLSAEVVSCFLFLFFEIV